MLVRVEGGTGAGVRKPLAPARREPWTCKHGHSNPRYATRCLVDRCNVKRP